MNDRRPEHLDDEDALAPWEQRFDESEKQFAAFGTYLQLPARVRSVRGAYRAHYDRPAHRGHLPDSFRNWASRFDWRERAAAWDRHRAREVREAELEALRAAAVQRVGAYRGLLAAGVQVIQKANLNELTAADARKLLPFVATMIEYANKGWRTEIGEPERIELTLKKQLMDEAQVIADALKLPVEDVLAEAERVVRDARRGKL